MPFPLDERWVVACEDRLGCRLPDTYRVAMMRSNGGTVTIGGDDWTLHPIQDRSDRKRMKRTSADIVYETAAMKGWTDWPGDRLKIAANGYGDALLLLRTTDGYGPEVLLWDHETGQSRRIAADFSEVSARIA